MRLVGYIRVSTRKQAEEGHGLDAQRALQHGWAGQHGHELIAVIPDVMTSRRTDRLHGREAAIRLVETGLADGLLILRWDRATRSLIDGQQLLERSRAAGWPILDTNGKSSLSKSDNLMTNMEQVIAEDERERISQRTKEGLAAARLKGKVPGRPAADLPGMTVHMLADLDQKGMSARAIAQTLNERGVPSPGGGARWSHSTVLRVLRRAEDERAEAAS
ncbi:recombinase family protein [Nocardioides humi]|uniref:Resolvase/invertase-type recombinase catalytic domain-containing protein n=1 Tax=Nocardioides humi TaxID=449461 RepID=A0ABN2BNR9_9ACTN|nr:recombinase family protein [Nocardioides humi]